MFGEHNVRASAEDNTGQNTKDTHPIPGQKLKFLTPPGIEPGPPGWKAGTLPTTPRRRINDAYNKVFHGTNIILFTSVLIFSIPLPYYNFPLLGTFVTHSSRAL